MNVQSKIVRDFNTVWNRNVKVPALFVIFDKPTDFPNHFVVRLFYGSAGTPYCALAKSLSEARACIPAGLVCFKRSVKDAPCVVESWL